MTLWHGNDWLGSSYVALVLLDRSCRTSFDFKMDILHVLFVILLLTNLLLQHLLLTR